MRFQTGRRRLGGDQVLSEEDSLRVRQHVPACAILRLAGCRSLLSARCAHWACTFDSSGTLAKPPKTMAKITDIHSLWFCSQKSEIKESQGRAPSRGGSFLLLAFLVAPGVPGLWPHCSNPCLHGHTAFSSESVSEIPSPYRDPSHWVRIHPNSGCPLGN